MVSALSRSGERLRAVQPRGRYANGEGVLKDEAEAVRWYRLSADQGNATAQYNLGVSYSNGEGVLKDSVLAHMWFNIAGANGNEAAREGRDNLERDMTRDEITRATELARACMASDYQNCERPAQSSTASPRRMTAARCTLCKPRR